MYRTLRPCTSVAANRSGAMGSNNSPFIAFMRSLGLSITHVMVHT